VTPSRPCLKGSTPAMETVPVGARRLPESRRRRVVLPAPLASHTVNLSKTIHMNTSFARACYRQSRACGSLVGDRESHLLGLRSRLGRHS